MFTNIENLKRINVLKGTSKLPAKVTDRNEAYFCSVQAVPSDTHLMCGISGAYFRKIFFSNFGTNPKDYISKKRLSHAKAILDSGNYYTISEVAASVGYSDPLYFSRAFRKKYGISPSECNK